MANTATLMVRILGDASSAQKAMGKFEATMSKAVVPAAAVTGALVVMGAQAVKSASNLQQAQGAVDAVFGKSAKVVENYASTSATRLGVSASEYMNSAALMGTALQNAGYSSEQAAKVSDQAWKRASDMAALYGGTGAEAMDAINAAVGRGEFEQLERYGVSLKADSVNALLAAKGQDKLTGTAKRNAQAQAIMGEIMKQSGKAAGQFGRESDTAAVQQQKMTAQLEDAKAAIGTGLLPLMAKLAGALAKAASWTGDHSREVTILAGVLAGLAGAVLAVNAAIKIYRATQVAIAAATKVWAAMQWLLNAAMAANPIVLIVLAIVALVAIFIVAYKKSETFRKIVDGALNAIKATAKKVADFFTDTVPAAFQRVLDAALKVWGWIKANWPLLLAILAGPIGIAVGLVVKNWDRIKAASIAVFDFLKGFIVRIWDGIRGYFEVVFGIYSSIFRAGWRVIRAVTLAVVNWFRNIVRAVFGGIRAYFSTVFGIYRAIFSRSWSVIKALTRAAFNAAKTFILNPMKAALAFIRSIPGRVRSGLSNLLATAKQVFSGAFNAAKSTAVGILNSFIAFVRGIPGKAKEALSSIGSKIKSVIEGIDLFRAGAALISGLTDGIQSKIESAVDVVRKGAQKIKDLWPGSPVKSGPLTAWNNGRAGVRLMALLAKGIAKGAAEVERAAELAAYGINGGLSITATAAGSPQVNVSVPDAGPTVVEVHLDGQVIGRYVQKKVDASIGSQARRIVLGAVS